MRAPHTTLRSPAPMVGDGPGGALRQLRDLCRGGNLAVLAVMAVAWAALVVWSGTGPKGWQARICADLVDRPQACGTFPLGAEFGRDPGKDQSRLQPVAAAQDVAS